MPQEKGKFLDVMAKFSFIESCSVVKIFGLILQPLALVMELLPLGSLNRYLKENKSKIGKVSNNFKNFLL